MYYKEKSSLVVDAEDDSSAEKTSVLVSKRSIVVVEIVPKALGSNTNSLTLYLSNNRLNNDLVGGNAESSACLFDFVCDLLSLCLGVSMVVLFVLQVVMHDGFDQVSHFARVESVALLGLKPICIFKCGSIEFSHI